MKYRLVILTAAFVMASIAGCERKSQPDEPKAFDPKIDSPAAPFDVRYDPLLVANQKEVAKMSGKKRPAATPAAGTEPLEAVKQTIAELAKAVATKDPAQITPFFADEEDVRTILQLDKRLAELNEKGQALANLVKERLGVDLPAETGVGQIQSQSGGITAELAKLPENLKIEINEGTAVISDPNSPIKENALTLVQIEGAWKIQFSPAQKQLLSLMVEMFAALSKSFDSISAGVLDGMITQENLKTKTVETIAANTKSVNEKLMKIMKQPMAEAGAKPEPAAASVEVAAGGGQNGPERLDDAVALWTAGKKDEAVDVFLKIDWTKTADFPGKSAFGMTSREYAALPSTDRTKEGPYEAQLKALRDLSQYVKTKADSEADKDKAGRYIATITNCAMFLSDLEKPTTVRNTGKALTRIIIEPTTAPAAPEGPTAEQPPPAAEPNAAPPAVLAAPATKPAQTTEPALEDDVNKGRGPEKAKELRDTLMKPARRAYGGGQ